MIKESIQHTITLIEVTQKVDPEKYQEQEIELIKLVQHMKAVINQF